MNPDEADVHFTYMTAEDGVVVAVCTASSRFDSRFRSSSRFEDVTCPACISEWKKVIL